MDVKVLHVYLICSKHSQSIIKLHPIKKKNYDKLLYFLLIVFLLLFHEFLIVKSDMAPTI